MAGRWDRQVLAMTPPSPRWGDRLSDTIRARLDAGELEDARRLVLEGDGEARSLEKEYSLMYKGLGITIRILLDLLHRTCLEPGASDRARSARGIEELLRRFRAEMSVLLRRVGAVGVSDQPGPEAPDPEHGARGAGLEAEFVATTRLVADAEGWFSRAQAQLAHEVLRAIDAADAHRARVLLDRKERDQYLPLHDRLIRLMADIFGWVLRELGAGELYRFHLETAERQRDGFEKWERLSPAEFARATAFLLKQHMGAVEVREEAARFTILQAPCGSGGRLRLSGAYEGPEALPFVEAEGPLTAGLERLPVYCSHCPVWNSAAPIEWFGQPQWVFDNPARPDGSCTLYIDKARRPVPRADSRRSA